MNRDIIQGLQTKRREQAAQDRQNMGKEIAKALFAGNGEIAALLRACFSQTDTTAWPFPQLNQIGPIETWSASLKSALSIMLNARSPMFLVWGHDRTLLYNDAYAALLSTCDRLTFWGQSIKHHQSSGWGRLQSDIESVFSTGQPLQPESVSNACEDGFARSAYNWVYTPVWDEANQVRGVFATGHAIATQVTTLSQVCQAEKEQAEIALRESEVRFQAFMRHSPTAAWIVDQEGRLLYLNPTYLRMFQLPQQNILHQPLQAVYSEAVAQQFLTNNQHVFETNQGIEFIESGPRPDGSVGNFLVYKFPIVQESQKVLLGGIAIDITEQKRNEETIQSLLRVSEKLNSTLEVNELLDNLIKEAIRLVNAESGCSGLYTPAGMVCYHYVRCDEAFPLEYCWPPEQGLPGWLICHKEPYLTNAVATDPHTLSEFYTRFEVNSVLSIPILNAQGDILGFFEVHNKQEGTGFTALDQEQLVAVSQIAAIAIQNALSYQTLRQTEATLQRREEELKLIANSVPALIAYVDQNQRYRFVNHAYEMWFGIPTTEVIDQHIHEILGESGYATLHPYIQQALAGQLVTFECQVAYRYGEKRYINANYIPHINSQGQVEGYISLVSDISDRKRTEEALHNSTERLSEREQRLDLATSAAQLGVFEWNIQTDHVVWENQRMYEILGQPPEAGAIPKTEFLNSVIHPDDRQKFEQYLALKLKRGKPFQATCRIRRRHDGQWRWIEFNGHFTLGSDGTPLQLVGVVADITDRKQVEESLSQSEERLRLAQQAAGAGLWDWDIKRDRITWSPEYYRLYGLEPTISPSYDNWLASIVESDRAQVDRITQEALAHHCNLNVEFQIAHPTLGIRWLAMIGQTFYDANGHPQRMTGIALDITNRKQVEESLSESEKRFRALADNIVQFAWMADATGWVFWYNRRWFDYTGTTLAEMIGWGWQKVHHPDYVEQVTEKFCRCIQAGEAWEDTFPLRRKDGHYGWFLSHAIPIRDEQGNVLRWFGTNTDITERLQAEQERERLLERAHAAREEAETANRIKDEFLAVLSHELRSPLNPILGWTKLLQTRQFDAAGTKRALETIERNAKLQTQLIDDLLDVSRILRGKMVLNIAPLNLNTVIDAALETVRLSAEAKAIAIQKVVSGEIGLISGDSSRLQQIVWNLLSNAVKFTPSGGCIEIRLEQIGTHACIQVKDTGKGISPDFLPYVFEYFRQEDGTITRKFGGLGLGLAIVRYLTEQHGGTVTAASPGEGLGATFTVFLPFVKATNESPNDGGTTSTSVVNQVPLANVRILVVDDEADMRELIFTVLEQSGAAVNLAASAADALQALSSFKPDVLISDIGMPGMDGYHLARQMRRLPREQGGQIPAIALTAYAGEIDQQRALAAGFVKHLAKPVEPEVLIQAIATLVSSH